jgi:hypothetical protein
MPKILIVDDDDPHGPRTAGLPNFPIRKSRKRRVFASRYSFKRATKKTN